MENYSKKILEKSIILLIIMGVIIYIAVLVLGTDSCPQQVIKDSQITGTIFYTNGQVKKNLKPDKWRLTRGDRLKASIKLPSRKPYTNTSLCFYSYNAVVILDIKGNVIYDYGKNLAFENRQIGNLMVITQLPDYAWGGTLNLTVIDQKKTPQIQDSRYILIPTEYSRVFPIAGHGIQFVIFSVLMIIGTGLGLGGIIFSGDRKNGTVAATIGLAIFLLCCWYFGYNRFFYAISTNIRINALAEYVALHLVAIPVIGFVYTAIEETVLKKIVFRVGIFVAAFSLVAIGLSIAGITTLSDTLPVLQIILGFLLVFLVFLVVDGFKHNRSVQDSLLVIGITSGMVFGVLEIGAIRVKTIKDVPRYLVKAASVDYAAVCLGILILTLLIWAVGRFYTEMRMQAEQEELEKLAYTDQLTGIPNRISCTEKMRALTDDDWYTVAFFDVDGLKYANDNYGHKVGDALIKSTADLINDHFLTYDGFFGRWGGDEFVAVFVNESGCRMFQMLWDEAVRKKAEESNLPVPFSVSVGFSEHKPGMKKSINEMINEADERMYYSKCAKKVERK